MGRSWRVPEERKKKGEKEEGGGGEAQVHRGPLRQEKEVF